jgi:hypothetical protein
LHRIRIAGCRPASIDPGIAALRPPELLEFVPECRNIGLCFPLALMAWAAFIKSGNNAVTYGDLVVLEEEVNPVISKLEERGLELSALHNHLLHEMPRVMYIHFVGRGDEVELAKGVREALALTKSPLGATASAPETS